jgi:hypothetical protein
MVHIYDVSHGCAAFISIKICLMFDVVKYTETTNYNGLLWFLTTIK